MSFLTEWIVNFIAEAIGEVITRNRKARLFPEGHVNASLGAVAAFAGALALMFAIPALIFTAYSGQCTLTGYTSLILVSLMVGALGYGGRRAGLRAPQVSSRNLVLASFGSFVSTLATGMALIAAIGYVIRFVVRVL